MTDWLADVWSYPARVETVHDGDTITVVRDSGCEQRHQQTIRVQNVDTTETNRGDELSKQWAAMAKEFTQEWCDDARPMASWPVRLWTEKVNVNTGDPKRSFTRYVAHIDRFDGASLGQWLAAKGLAIPVRDWQPSRWPGGIYPGAWVREAGTANKVHLVRQATPVESACGVEFVAPARINNPHRGERCGRCWDWSAYSTPLWAEIVATDTRLQYGSGFVMAHNHPGARFLQ